MKFRTQIASRAGDLGIDRYEAIKRETKNLPAGESARLRHGTLSDYFATARVRRCLGFSTALFVFAAFTSASAPAQVAAPARPGDTPPQVTVTLMQPGGQGQSGAPLTLTLQDALSRAQKNDPQFLSAVSDAKSAHEDLAQAKAARLPSVSYRMDYLGTQGNGVTPNGRFVTNDGVHVYRAWGVIHEEINANTFMGTATQRASAGEALAQAKADIAQRGLTVTVTRNYYALVASQRKYATAQQSLDQARRFFELTADTERAGQAAHSDVMKAEIVYQQQQQAFEEAKLTMETARLGLAVILFPALNENFTVVDDLDSPRALPPFEDVQNMAAGRNPDLRVALQSVRQADLDVTAAKTAFLPRFVIEPVYGIEANELALHSRAAAFPEIGKLPNLGYFVTASMVLPIWDWGTLRSKVRQSEFKQEQARVELSQTQRQLVANLYGAYNEAAVARVSVERFRRAADLATETLRLVTLRYQSGASTILEVVDAQNTLTSGRNAYEDALVRYRLALTALSALTGTF